MVSVGAFPRGARSTWKHSNKTSVTQEDGPSLPVTVSRAGCETGGQTQLPHQSPPNLRVNTHTLGDTPFT